MLGFGQPRSSSTNATAHLHCPVGGLAGWVFATRAQQGLSWEGIIAQESPPDAEFSKYPHDGSQ